MIGNITKQKIDSMIMYLFSVSLISTPIRSNVILSWIVYFIESGLLKIQWYESAGVVLPLVLEWDYLMTLCVYIPLNYDVVMFWYNTTWVKTNTQY